MIYFPIAHTTPRVLGEVWNSYGRAKPTQIDPRNERDKTRKRTRKSTNLTARDRSDQCSTPVRPVGPVRPVVDTGKTGCSQRAREKGFKC